MGSERSEEDESEDELKDGGVGVCLGDGIGGGTGEMGWCGT